MRINALYIYAEAVAICGQDLVMLVLLCCLLYD